MIKRNLYVLFLFLIMTSAHGQETIPTEELLGLFEWRPSDKLLSELIKDGYELKFKHGNYFVVQKDNSVFSCETSIYGADRYRLIEQGVVPERFKKQVKERILADDCLELVVPISRN